MVPGSETRTGMAVNIWRHGGRGKPRPVPSVTDGAIGSDNVSV